VQTLTGVGLSFGLELGAPDEPRLAEEILNRAFLGSSVISTAKPRGDRT
jgi:hypothetical protein